MNAYAASSTPRSAAPTRSRARLLSSGATEGSARITPGARPATTASCSRVCAPAPTPSSSGWASRVLRRYADPDPCGPIDPSASLPAFPQGRAHRSTGHPGPAPPPPRGPAPPVPLPSLIAYYLTARPSRIHLALARAPQYCVECRKRDVLEQVHPVPGLTHVRGLRACAACGIIFSRDKMAGTDRRPPTRTPRVRPVRALITVTAAHPLCPQRLRSCWRVCATCSAASTR